MHYYSQLSLMVATLLLLLLSIDGSFCTLNTIVPSLGPSSGGTNITVRARGMNPDSPTYLFGVQEIQPSTSLIYTSPQQDNLDDIILTGLRGCNGSLPFQYYPSIQKLISSAMIVLEIPTVISLNGGQFICLNFDNFFMQSTEFIAIRLQSSSNLGAKYIDFPVAEKDKTNTTKVNEHSLCARTSNSLNSTFAFETLLDIYIALNGQQFELYKTNVAVERRKPYKAAFIFDDTISSELAWNYKHAIARIESTGLFPISLQSTDIGGIDTYIPGLLDSVLEEGKFDMVFIYSGGPAVSVSEVADKYPQTQIFVVGTPILDGSFYPLQKNLNYYWAHQYHAFYINGYMCGLVLPQGGDICYIRANNHEHMNLTLNAFGYGLLKTNPTARLTEVFLNSYVDIYAVKMKTMEFVASGCKILVMDMDVRNGIEIFVDNGLKATGAFADARVFQGDNVLTSMIISWTDLYTVMLQEFFDGKAGGKFYQAGLIEGVSFATALSPVVPPDIQVTVHQEIDRLKKLRPENVILCGPVYDNNGIKQFDENYCPSMEELYSLDWQHENVISFGLYHPPPPKHDDNTIPQGLIGAALAFLIIFYLIIFSLGIWTYLYREHPIVKFAQLQFLYLLLIGCFVGLTSVAPLAMQRGISDDEAFRGSTYIADLRKGEMDAACQSIPWLLLTGFVTTFPFLFLKSWKLHCIISKKPSHPSPKSKTYSSLFDPSNMSLVYIMTFLYFLAIFLTMISWQTISPLTWHFTVVDLDTYGNVISSYGSCYKNYDSQKFLFVIASLVFIGLVIGNIVAFICRRDETVNNEIMYITISELNYLQIILIAVPLVALNEQNPTIKFLVSVSAVFITFGGLLLLMFVPKVLAVLEEKDKVVISVTVTKREDVSLTTIKHSKDETSDSKSRVSNLSENLSITNSSST